MDARNRNNQLRQHQMIKALQDRGHRMTPQRVAVVKILSESFQHPSIERINEIVQNDFPMTSLATVYKTVSLLKEMGLVMEIAGAGNTGSRFDAIQDIPHPHLICNSCGEIVDLEPLEIDDISNDIAVKTGYKIKSHNLTFHGLCSRCRSEEKRSRMNHAHTVGASNV